MNARTLRRPDFVVGKTVLSAGWLALVLAGCGGGPDASAPSSSTGSPKAAGPTKVKVAYLGLTCEAPIFVAQEKGFYKEEGLETELVRTDWDGLRDGLGLGRFDANHTLIMYLLKPIEQGLDVKITGGIHTGCLRVQAGTKTEIKTVLDLKGKRVGIPTHHGSPPHLFASRVLAANGMDPNRDVTWVVLPPDVLGLQLDKGQIDAVADSEPIGSILLGKGLVRNIADQGADAPYKDEYCCAAVVSGKLAKRDPSAAAKVTRAMLKAARWVEANPTAAAKLSVEKKYLAASVELNALAISKLRYMPGVGRCRESLDSAAKEMKLAGLLNASTDPAELAKRAWLDLDGVTDQWVEGLKVEQIAGGGRPAELSPEELATLDVRPVRTCCNSKSATKARPKIDVAGTTDGSRRRSG